MDRKFCQSCGMPLDDPNMMGTEIDGSASPEYCKYCYQQGAYLNPALTFDDMAMIVRTEMQRRAIPQNTIDLALKNLPHLKRWQGHPVS